MGREAIGRAEGSPSLKAAYTHAVGAHRLLRRDDWLMLPGERAALEGVLSFVEPELSIEIGTHSGGSLQSISAHSARVHSFDLVSHPAVTQKRFPNVDFHIGDSHELLPLLLKELEQSGETIDFAFVDGDHSATGVRRDVGDLLGSSCTQETVILLHDTLNAEVRTALEQVDFSTFDSVCFVDLDLVHGRVAKEGQGANKLLWGLGMVVTGDRLDTEWPTSYSARELYADLSRSLLESGAIAEPFGHSQLVELDQEVARLKSVVQTMERSASWRVTRPLRDVKTHVRRLRHRRGAASA